MKTGMKVKNKYYSWEEIYKFCGCVEEDFLYDNTGTCYNDLVKAIEEKGEWNEIPS